MAGNHFLGVEKVVYMNLEELVETSESINKKRIELKKCIKETSQTVYKVREVWDSDLTDKYINEYKQVLVSVKEMDELLDSLSKNLTALANFSSQIIESNDI